MRTTVVLVALAASALAAPAPKPAPQDINFSDVLSDFAPFVDDQPTGPEYNATTETIPATSPNHSEIVDNVKADPATPGKLRRRDILKRTQGDCRPQPANRGPQFFGEPADWIAQVQAQCPPNNPDTLGTYTKVFDGLLGSVNQMGYLGLTTIHSYDINDCKARCDAKPGCLGFNLYVERDPSLDPGAGCPDPAPITNYKCTLWGFPFEAGAADNRGQTRYQFKVVIAASVAYVKPPPCSNLPDFDLYGSGLYGAINAPSLPADSYPAYQTNTYMGFKQYPTDDVRLNYYDPSICTAACDAQTAYNERHPPGLSSSNPTCAFKVCNCINSYVLIKNGKAQGMICSFYSYTWDNSYAVNGGSADGTVKVASSCTFSNNRLPRQLTIDTCAAPI
ncbi:hypothetical protein TWF696_003706 [Orbilia brochopaga]|uniref:Uncharacterized protein n=1 Tax=Orbilia brochopaga TaxID=3140254 RepID=A0AAV9V6Z7_9PEZI